MNNKELWANDRKQHNLRYPDENVIRFLCANRSVLPGNKLLDFGCGSGRNTRVMAELGFDTYAMDYSEECLKLTEEKCKTQVHYIKNTELDVPLESNSMDGIVAWGALFYLSYTDEELLFRELVRVLKPGGMLLADYRTKDDFLYGMGEKLDDDFYKLNEHCGSLAGITYAFRDLDSLKRLYQNCAMEIVNYEKIDHYVEQMTKRNSHYIIWAKKEGC